MPSEIWSQWLENGVRWKMAGNEQERREILSTTYYHSIVIGFSPNYSDLYLLFKAGLGQGQHCSRMTWQVYEGGASVAII